MTDVKFIAAIFCMLAGCVAVLLVYRTDGKGESTYGTPIRLIAFIIVVIATILVTKGWLDIRAKEANDLQIEQCMKLMGLGVEMSNRILVTDKCYIRLFDDIYQERGGDRTLYHKSELINKQR